MLIGEHTCNMHNLSTATHDAVILNCVGHGYNSRIDDIVL